MLNIFGNENNKPYSIVKSAEETCIDFSLVKDYFRNLAENKYTCPICTKLMLLVPNVIILFHV